MNPTEDTPTPSRIELPEFLKKHIAEVKEELGIAAPKQDDKLDTPNPPAQKLDKSGQQLREAVHKILVAWQVTYAGEMLDEILALFTTAQIQLVSELEGELAKSAAVVTDRHTFEYGYDAAMGRVKTILEHKKQELERRNNG